MRLFDRLEVYKNSQEVEGIQAGYQFMLDGIGYFVDDLLAQLYVDTATWGLALWEEYLGLTESVAPGSDYTARRETIKARLRGAGTTTVALIKSVSESYANGEVEITEDNAHYAFSVAFVSSLGQPPNLIQLKDAIEKVKPAHLAVSYVFIYTTHAELIGFTHADLAAYTHEQIRVLEV